MYKALMLAGLILLSAIPISIVAAFSSFIDAHRQTVTTDDVESFAVLLLSALDFLAYGAFISLSGFTMVFISINRSQNQFPFIFGFSAGLLFFANFVWSLAALGIGIVGFLAIIISDAKFPHLYFYIFCSIILASTILILLFVINWGKESAYSQQKI